MRRIAHDDSGAVAVMVAILSIVLFGMAALVIDVGRIYEERRELQNGADAAALAIAWECVQRGYGSANCPEDGSFPTTYAYGLANGNTANPATVLDTSVMNIAGRWVQVDLRATSDLNLFFAPILGFSTQAVGASARATLSADGAAPLAFSTCELLALAEDADDDSIGNPNTVVGSSANIVEDGADGNPGTPDDFDFDKPGHIAALNAVLGGAPIHIGFQGSGSECAGFPGTDVDPDTYKPLNGNFGWLDTTDCTIDQLIGDWVPGTGGDRNPRSIGCSSDSFDGTTELIVFDDGRELKGNDADLEEPSPTCFAPTDCYHYAAVLRLDVTNYRFSGMVLNPTCSNPETCIDGKVFDIITDRSDAEVATSFARLIPIP